MSVPSSSKPTKFAPGPRGPNDPYAPIVQDLYPQYDCYNVNTLATLWQPAPQLTPFIVAEYAAMQQVLSHIGKEGMQIEIMNVFHVTIHQTT